MTEVNKRKMCGDSAKSTIAGWSAPLDELVRSLKASGYKGRSIRYYIKKIRPDLWAEKTQEAQATFSGTETGRFPSEALTPRHSEKKAYLCPTCLRASHDYCHTRNVSTAQTECQHYKPTQAQEPALPTPSEKEKPLAGGCVEAPDERRAVKRGKRFVLTVAQNNTHVHSAFLDALKVYCKENDAQLLVAPCTYNKNGFQNLSAESDGLWYDPALAPYLVPTESITLSGPDASKEYEPIIFCADLDILPTAIRPLSGLQNYTRSLSCVVPHAKVAMESVPTVLDNSDIPKMMYTTGAVTQRNYIQRKAGQKADFHHVYGALVVEFNEENGHWYARQLAASTHGAFYDLDKHYSAGGVTDGHRPLTLVYGDLHLPHREGNRLPEAFGSIQSPLHVLRPRNVFLHDSIDFYAQNHHNRKSARHRVEASISVVDASTELNRARKDLAIIQAHCNKAKATMFIVWSNHMDALIRWVEEAQWTEVSRDDAELLLRLQRKAVMYPSNGRPNERDMADAAIFQEALGFYPLERSKPAEIKGVVHGLHGHLGPNGARGNPSNLNSIGSKVTCGHGHSARIVDGVYQVGVTCPMRLNYNKGPQAWSVTHCVMYPNGKRSLITHKGGAWKA